MASRGRETSRVSPGPVWAIVVTYNRKDLLRECLDALLDQTHPPDHVLVVDNASTDGTLAMVREHYPQFEILALPENVGCAGGNHAALKKAYEGPAEWFWVMDDDTIPTPTALEQLLEALNRLDGLPEPALLASKVLWTDGTLHRMSLPFVRWDREDFALEACERELVPLRATTYVSMLVKRSAVEKYGVPLAHWFIWGDDIEYTARILRNEVGYVAPRSVVLHKTKVNYFPAESDSPRFYYDVRNKLFMLRGTAWEPIEKLFIVLWIFRSAGRYLVFNRFRPANVAAVLRGLRDGALQEHSGPTAVLTRSG
jgi:rhamnopyranosyl-N-acetylglucosaminyl-diphospho-decaprenol beta-1,3/1,4-galactofuranosyltransferase